MFFVSFWKKSFRLFKHNTSRYSSYSLLGVMFISIRAFKLRMIHCQITWTVIFFSCARELVKNNRGKKVQHTDKSILNTNIFFPSVLSEEKSEKCGIRSRKNPLKTREKVAFAFAAFTRRYIFLPVVFLRLFHLIKIYVPI